MELNIETVLNVYTYKNRKILCQIKVNANNGIFKNSCRCLSIEQWMAFDKELEKLISTIDDWSNEKCLKFEIDPFILVKVQKSSLSFKHFLKCLNMVSDFVKEVGEEIEETNYILECLFDFQRKHSFSSSNDSQQVPTTDGMSCSPLSYDSYTPTIKKHKVHEINIIRTPGKDFLAYDESLVKHNDTRFAEKMQKSELKSTNTTSCVSKINKNGNFNEAFIDSEYQLNSVRCLRDNKSGQNDVENENKKVEYIQNESSQLSKPDESQECCKIKDTKFENNLKADTPRKPKKRSKSGDLFLEFNDETDVEKKKENIDTDYGHYIGITTKQSSNTLDELPNKIPLDTEKTLQKNIMEDVNKQRRKRIDAPHKRSTQHNKEKKKVSSFKEKLISDKQHESSLTEDKLTAASKKNATTESAKSPFENGNLSELSLKDSPQKSTRKASNLKLNNDASAVRRSQRSPSKPKRFINTQPEIPLKHKSHKHRELDGKNNDEDNLFEKYKPTILTTPVNKKPVQCTSSSSSKKHKRKWENSAECQQEKRDINKWLSKKNSTSLDHQAKISSKNSSKSKLLPLKISATVKSRKIGKDANPRSKSITPPPMTIELPSKEELELMRNKTNLMRKENAKMKAELDKLRISPPKEVAILSLEDIAADDILNTFSNYRAELDEVYENNCKKDHIKGHDGINHCFIIRLLQQSIQMKMLEKLTDVYGSASTTTQATLFANALLPEWVIRVYMEKFNFTRQQAIVQIKAQEAFQLHLEEQSELF